MEKEQKREVQVDEEGREWFIASTGIKVVLNNRPSPQACENFIRILLDIKEKYNIK